MVRDNRIPTLDLFSGIGGFSLGLKRVCRTIAYCEIDPAAQQILIKNIELGQLDNAPIHDDITSLQPGHLKCTPHMITAGFPCQDVSILVSNAHGLRGKRSGLVMHIFRLIDSFPSVKYVLLENSPALQSRGLHEIVFRLQSSGFQVNHRTFTAAQVGAPHLRRRLFILAMKKKPTIHLSRYLQKHWPNKACKRLLAIAKTDQTRQVRCSLLGNSVVPQVVLCAFAMLSGCRYSISSPRCMKNLTMSDNKITMSKTLWATPVAKTWTFCVRLTSRCAKNLPTQVLLATDTVIPYVSIETKLAINPHFVEWMMGYPKDWTLI